MKLFQDNGKIEITINDAYAQQKQLHLYLKSEISTLKAKYQRFIFKSEIIQPNYKDSRC